MEDKKPYPFDSGEIFEKGEIDTSSFTKEEFELVHREAGEKIHDTKMQGKPTTFAKDAIRRFAKNKSSVVAAAIIGVLLIASFLAPVVSPYDITTPVASISKMVPRIRPASDGFWDGTQYFSGQTYDEEAGVPVGFEKRCIVDGSMKYDGIQYQSGDPKPGYAYGYLRVRGDYLFSQKANNVFFQSYKTTKFSVGDGVKMTITFGLEDDIEGGVLASPSVYLYGQNNMAENVSLEAYPINSLSPRFLDDSAEEGDEEISTEEEFSSEEAIEIDGESVVTYDLSEALGNSEYTSLLKARPRLEFAPSDEGLAYILIKSIRLTCDEEASDATKEFCEAVSWDNANAQGLTKTTDADYWQSTGRRLVVNSYRHTVSFRYDQYEKVLGTRDDVVIGGSQIKAYIANGWCEMDDLNDVSTFRLTDPDSTDCPVREIRSVSKSVVGGIEIYEYECTVLFYRYLGFKSMPNFVFGTDANGYDMLTLSLSCLKNSLLLAIISSAICLAIGLVWGSISGYFGGAVDLTMERITDILSGIPWIVVMTLVMLLLGRTVVTFGIAICLTGWIGTSSRTRTQFYRFKGREYVLASRTLGASDGRLIFRHILPNGLGTIVTGSVLMIPSTIFSEATLSYLGLGLQGTDSFGVLLADNQANLSSRPMLVIWPAIIISLLMISFNLFGNGLRDALNPTLKGGEQ